MPLLELPSFAKPIEIRLTIQNSISEGHRSEVNRGGYFPPNLREMWTLGLALAPMSPANAEALAAFIERLDGKVEAFKIQMLAGIYGASVAGLTLNAATTRGAETISLVVPTGGVDRGTLFSLGDIDTAEFQLFEVVAGAAAGVQNVRVAPRVRYAFGSGATIAASSPFARFRLADDGQGRPRVDVSKGVATLQLVEAV